MTGGAGFSRDSSQSFKDNHELGKIRPRSSYIKSSRNLENVDSKAISEGINHRISRKSALEKNRKLVLLIVITTALILTYFFI
ncbi:hypothetical protein [Algoriphagus sp.]|uniref:hypothetical protein n=1 Tax=Algoriphagus sp. TaxID=1872435 RepID=UPI00391A74DF